MPPLIVRAVSMSRRTYEPGGTKATVSDTKLGQGLILQP